MIFVGADTAPDDLAGLFAKAGRLQRRPGRFGVGVGIQRENLVADVVLDEGERSTRCRVVGVGDSPRSERTAHDLVTSDDGGADGG